MMISPSLLSADFTRLSEEIQEIELAGADMLHLDIMDGRFVPNITFGPFIVKQIREITQLPLDVHLMIESPEKYVDAFIDAGADYLTVHIESTVHANRLLTEIKRRKVKAGVSLNPSTPVVMLEEVIHLADLVLVMSVNPGFGGQSFIEQSIDKIKRVKKMIDIAGTETLIEVDGGVNDVTAKKLWHAGADILVAGSYIFSKDDYSGAIASLRR